MKLQDLLGENYKEGMTLEEIEKMLEGVSLPSDNSDEIVKLKNAVSKANSEAASYKKQLNEKLTAEELKAKESAEQIETLRAEHEALQKKVFVSEKKAELMGIGYDEKLAESTATAMMNGEHSTVIANAKKYAQAQEQRIKEELLKSTSRPDGGNAQNSITKEQFDSMDYSERVKLFEESPELYAELNKD